MPEALFTCRQLASASGGEWLQSPPPDFQVFSIKTDTREDCSNALFLALAGENFNAHDFLDKAAQVNAAALCIQIDFRNRIRPEWRLPVLLVENTLTAYQRLACCHKRRFAELKTIGVTGSMGKTSVKEMLRAIFIAKAGEKAVLATHANTNNQVGVPQNLLRLTAEHRYAIIEMGTNHFGEIEPLSRAAEPDCAVISSIAPCHLEFLRDLRGVATEKAQIFAGLPSNGSAVIPAQCPENDFLRQQAEKFRTLCFGTTPDCAVRTTYLGGNLHGSSFELFFIDDKQKLVVNWPLSGRHQAENAAAAACAALSVGIEPQTIAAGLALAALPGMRMKVTEINGVNWVNDAYNASPGSVAASLQWLAEFADAKTLILTLGDMLELGAHAPGEHLKTLKKAVNIFPQAKLLLVGRNYAQAATQMTLTDNVILCYDAETAAARLAAIAAPGMTVFLKGSRGMKLEKIVPQQ